MIVDKFKEIRLTKDGRTLIIKEIQDNYMAWFEDEPDKEVVSGDLLHSLSVKKVFEQVTKAIDKIYN